MGSTRFRNPRALSSALASLGTLQPRALGFLNPVDPMDSMSNLYVDQQPRPLKYPGLFSASMALYQCVRNDIKY